MLTDWLLEPLRAYWARKRLERLQYETAASIFRRAGGVSPLSPHREGPQRVEDDPDADDWRLLTLGGKALDDNELQTIRDKARQLADYNPYARNILTLYRNYTVGTGMRHEIVPRESAGALERESAVDNEGALSRSHVLTLSRVAALWHDFLSANDWATGNRKDWEFCLRTWRDGECFLRLFRQPAWPPRVHFVDPEHVGPDPQTGLPAGGIETAPGNVEMPLAFWVVKPSPPDPLSHARERGRNSLPSPLGGRGAGGEGVERIDAGLMLHTKIGVDANVKRGVSIFLPVMDALKRFQGWLDVELIQRKVASSIVLVRKHLQNNPGGVASFADSVADPQSLQPLGLGGQSTRRQKIQPGTIIDTQGFDLQFLSPDTHFDDASLLGRMILLSIAAGTGLPEFMLSADASNANYASTLVAEGPAVRYFAAWQAFFIGQWQKLFQMLLREAVRLGMLEPAEARQVTLKITPPTLAVRNRHQEAQADALYYDRGALSARELARRDAADPELMQRERSQESGIRSQKSES